jgi:mRNA interferase RelE/StbE
MVYHLVLKRSAEKDLDSLTTKTRARIVKTILLLEEEPRPAGVKKLAIREGYRLRVGSYRVLYEIDDENQTVRIFAVGHRRDVYR